MATIIGRDADVDVSSDDITYTPVGKVTSAALAINDDLADETNNDSGGYKQTKYADQQAVLSLGFKYDDADAGQAMLLASKSAKSTLYYRYRPKASAGTKQWKFQANISELSVNAETSAVEDGSATIESTGTVTMSTQ